MNQLVSIFSATDSVLGEGDEREGERERRGKGEGDIIEEES